jgi:hypothetical protein
MSGLQRTLLLAHFPHRRYCAVKDPMEPSLLIANITPPNRTADKDHLYFVLFH